MYVCMCVRVYEYVSKWSDIIQTHFILLQIGCSRKQIGTKE